MKTNMEDNASTPASFFISEKYNTMFNMEIARPAIESFSWSFLFLNKKMVIRERRVDPPVRIIKNKLLPAFSVDMVPLVAVAFWLAPPKKGNRKLRIEQEAANNNQRLCWRWIIIYLLPKIRQEDELQDLNGLRIAKANIEKLIMY